MTERGLDAPQPRVQLEVLATAQSPVDDRLLDLTIDPDTLSRVSWWPSLGPAPLRRVAYEPRMERRSIAAEVAAKRGAAHDVWRLIATAHPNFRDEPTPEARTIGYVT